MRELHGARYIVTVRRTGQVAAEGAAAACARQLGMGQASFRAMASRSRRSGSQYRVERLAKTPWQTQAAQEWDRRFGWYRAQDGPPCARCGRRAACAYTDGYCPAFARWYAAAYDQAAERLRRAAAHREKQSRFFPARQE